MIKIVFIFKVWVDMHEPFLLYIFFHGKILSKTLTAGFLSSNVNRATRYTYHWESALQCFNSSHHQMAWKYFKKGWTFYLWQDADDVDFSERSCRGKMLDFSQNFTDAKLNKNFFTCNLAIKSTKLISVDFKNRGKSYIFSLYGSKLQI